MSDAVIVRSGPPIQYLRLVIQVLSSSTFSSNRATFASCSNHLAACFLCGTQRASCSRSIYLTQYETLENATQ